MSVDYLKGGEPFELGSGGAGVLALHGFTGSPFEVRALADLLHAQGFSVYAPALAGHATKRSDLDATSADDYLEAAERAYDEARRKCDRLYVVGLSVGGTLGLYLAACRPVPGLVTISAPVFLYPMINASVPVIEQMMPGLRTPANFAAWQGNVIGYKSMPIAAVRVVIDLLDRVRPMLEKVASPVLVVHSTRDYTVPLSSARAIHENVASAVKQLEVIEAGSHLMTVEPNLSLIGSTVVGFLKGLEAAVCPEGR
jgi:carboxylesterase